MSTHTGPADYGRFDELAEEFAGRFRRGERPSLQEYIDRCPELAAEIRELFPALVEMEQAEDHRDEPEAAAAPAKADVPELGQIGDYRILREVGRGGMGVVYEAEQVSLGRRVALKVLPRQAARDGTILERFRREARAAARLHHTNIVPVYEVGQDGDVRFYAMQFIQGQGLDSVIGELKRLRGRFEPALAAATSARRLDRRSRDGRDGPAPEVATLPEGIEVSQVVRSILVGKFGPVGSATAPVGSSRSVIRRTLAGAIAPRSETLGGPPTSGGATMAAAPAAGHDGRVEPGPPPEAGPSPGSWSPPSSCPTSAVLPGGTQLSTVESSRRAFYRSLAHIGRQVAGGLAYAHARGIVHRDIKPSNLILDTDGVVWIADFGLAKGDEEGLTHSGDILGTLRYMAPERFRGQGDARADIYALGLTLYEVLTLRPGFDTADRLALIEQINVQEPPRPRDLDSRIPRDLETIVLKAIEKDPRTRYQTAEAIGEDLRRFLADEPIQARQVTAVERYWRWARRNPAIAVLGGVLTGVLIVATLLSMAAASHFRGLASREKRANDQSHEARKIAVAAQRQAIEERDHSRRLSADLTLEKGIALARAGHAERGLLWMLEALRTAPEDAEDFRKTVRWNLGTWLGQVHKPLWIMEAGGPSTHLVVSPDGTSFATGFSPEDRTIWKPIDLWDATSGRKRSALPGTFAPIAFRPDGRVAVAHADPWHVVAVDLATGRVLWTTPELPGEWGATIEFSRDGSSVLATRRDRPGAHWFLRFDAATGRQRGEPIPGRGSMTVTPDGEAVATFHLEGGEAFIDIYELPSGRRTSSWPTGKSNGYLVRFGPDGKSLFSVVIEGDGFDQNNLFGQGWATGAGRPTTPLIARTTGGLYTPAADRLLTQTDNVMLVRDGATGRVRGSGFPPDSGLTDSNVVPFHRDGRTLIAHGRDNTIRSWQISADAEPISTGPTDRPTATTGKDSNPYRRGTQAFRAGLRSDGRIAISLARSVADRERIAIAEPASGRLIGRPMSHQAGWIIGSAVFSLDGRSVATGSNPDNRLAGEVRLWDADTGRPRLPPMLHTNYVRALAFRPDGKILAAGDFNGLVRFWDTSTGREIDRPLAQGEIVLSLAYSPDGTILAAGLASDHSGKPGTRLWDTTTGRPLGGLLPSAHNVDQIDFRPDGRAFLAGHGKAGYTKYGGSFTRLWDTALGKAISEPIDEEISGGFRPDGRAFLTLGREGTVKLRDAMTGEALATLSLASSGATCAAFRGDGGLVAVGFEDGTVRLCDPATSQPVGPPRSMRHAVLHVAFRPDGRSVAAIDELGESRTWSIPGPLEDSDFDDLALRIEARTGLRMEAGLSISRLGDSAWSERLEQLGRLDPAAARADTDPAWHEPMIVEAERDGNAFAAIWHLDCLIAVRPDDWSLRARRGRAWSRSDRFDRAIVDYQQAERLGRRDDVLDFQLHCVFDCTRAERWPEALWYLDRLIAARPDDEMLHEDRAAVYGKLGRSADRQAELARVFELGADEGLVIPRAEELGRAGRWAEAAGLLARCGRRDPVGRELAHAWSIACLKAGDHAGYREACAAFLAREGPNPTVVWNELAAASLLALAPGAIDDYRVPISWLGKRLAATPRAAAGIPALLLERTGRAVAPRRPPGRGDRSPRRGDRRREGLRDRQRLGLPGAGPRARRAVRRSPPLAWAPPRLECGDDGDFLGPPGTVAAARRG